MKTGCFIFLKIEDSYILLSASFIQSVMICWNLVDIHEEKPSIIQMCIWERKKCYIAFSDN